jgi:aspartyl-tRNA(Asn)/glutamyl-tRNA(Gln) amidotransferase subunit B
MRTKEDAADYRYFPDPDLPPLIISPEWIEEIRAEMPENPRELANKYVETYGLTPYLASQVTSSDDKASLFEAASFRNVDIEAISAERLSDPAFLYPFVRRIAVWVSGEVSRKMNETEGLDSQFWIDGRTLGRIALREHDGVISTKAAKALFEQIWNEDRIRKTCRGPDDVDALIEAQGLKQVNDSSALEAIIDDVLAANADNIAQYRAGKDKAFNALVGQAMKASKGKANPAQVNAMLKAKLG